MKIGKYILGVIFTVFLLVAIGGMIGVNDQNNINNGVYTDEFRDLFGGVNQSLTVDPLAAANEFANVTDISAASGEDGTFQEYKIANKVDSTKVSIWDQGKNIVGSYTSFTGFSLLGKLLITIITISLVIAGIEFFRRYKL